MIEPQMVVIEAGKVTLGLPACDSRVQHPWPKPMEVDLPRFGIARYPVTVGEYRRFLRATGYPAPPQLEEHRFNKPDLPAVGLSWDDAAAYVNWLAGATRKPYRLPTDAEWEKAARGGLHGKRFPWGDDPPQGRCCFGQDADTGAPTPVGSFAPNGYGLYEMVGHVWQWCSDLYVQTIAGDRPKNSPTQRSPEENRVLRGGSFMTQDAGYLHCAYRHEDPPDLRHPCLGMRVAMDV